MYIYNYIYVYIIYILFRNTMEYIPYIPTCKNCDPGHPSQPWCAASYWRGGFLWPQPSQGGSHVSKMAISLGKYWKIWENMGTYGKMWFQRWRKYGKMNGKLWICCISSKMLKVELKHVFCDFDQRYGRCRRFNNGSEWDNIKLRDMESFEIS